MYPIIRNRRLRASNSLRSLVQETTLTVNDLIVPLFVVEGVGIREEIMSMPGQYRMSLDVLEDEIQELITLKLKAVLYSQRPMMPKRITRDQKRGTPMASCKEPLKLLKRQIQKCWF